MADDKQWTPAQIEAWVKEGAPPLPMPRLPPMTADAPDAGDGARRYDALETAIIRADNAAEHWREHVRPSQSAPHYEETPVWMIVVGSYAIVAGGFAALFVVVRLLGG